MCIRDSCTAARRAAWLREKDALAQEVSVPVGSDPPPAPNCGWVLVRELSLIHI